MNNLTNMSHVDNTEESKALVSVAENHHQGNNHVHMDQSNRPTVNVINNLNITSMGNIYMSSSIPNTISITSNGTVHVNQLNYSITYNMNIGLMSNLKTYGSTKIGNMKIDQMYDIQTNGSTTIGDMQIGQMYDIEMNCATKVNNMQINRMDNLYLSGATKIDNIKIKNMKDLDINGASKINFMKVNNMGDLDISGASNIKNMEVIRMYDVDASGVAKIDDMNVNYMGWINTSGFAKVYRNRRRINSIQTSDLTFTSITNPIYPSDESAYTIINNINIKKMGNLRSNNSMIDDLMANVCANMPNLMANGSAKPIVNNLDIDSMGDIQISRLMSQAMDSMNLNLNTPASSGPIRSSRRFSTRYNRRPRRVEATLKVDGYVYDLSKCCNSVIHIGNNVHFSFS